MVSSLWVTVDLQYLALYLFFSISIIDFSILLCKQLSLFHHSDRMSLLKASKSTEAPKLYIHIVCLIMVCNLITLSTIKKIFCLNKFYVMATSVSQNYLSRKIPLSLEQNLWYDIE